MEVGFQEQKELLANWKRLVTAGLGMARAVEVLREGRSTVICAALTKLQKAADDGQNLSQSRSVLVQLFGEIVAELLIAGEQSGSLEKSLSAASAYVETRLSIRKKMLLASAYPLFVASCGLLLLPIPTLFRDGFTAALWGYYLPVLTVFILLYMIFQWIRSQWDAKGNMRVKLENFVSGIPIIGSFFLTLVARLFFGTLSCLLSAGASMAAAVESACLASSSHLLAKRAAKMRRGAEEGQQLSVLLSGTLFLPKGALQEIRVGEETGNVENACENISIRCDEELATKGTALAFGAAVLMVGLVFLAVIYHVISFWLGYFQQGADAGLF